MTNLNCGLSGCKIEMVDNHTIKKYSSGLNYNQRLSKQIDKQIFFSLQGRNVCNTHTSPHVEEFYSTIFLLQKIHF